MSSPAATLLGAGEEKLLSLGGRLVDQVDAFEPLALHRLSADVISPSVFWVAADVLAREEPGPLGAVAVAGVAAAGLQPPRGVPELVEEVGDGGERL